MPLVPLALILTAVAAWTPALGPGGLHARRSHPLCTLALGDSPQDKLIGQLRDATPQEIPQLLAANMKAIDQRLFLRLAELSDAEVDESERDRIQQLASTVTTALEALLDKADSQLDKDAANVQSLLRAVATEGGEFELPVPADRALTLRSAMRTLLPALDEGFVGTVKAYMQKASEDGLEGMVEVLRTLLQTYASERLIALGKNRLEPAVATTVGLMLEAPPDTWDEVMREQLLSADAACGADELVDALQDQMGEVVLGMPAGSAVQTVLAEYLNELLTRARSVSAEA